LQKQVDGKSLGYIIPGNISEFSETLYKEGLVKAITKQSNMDTWQYKARNEK